MHLLNHVPPWLRREVFKSFAHGWLQCLQAVAGVLRRINPLCAPTVSEVKRHLSLGSSDGFAMERGGLVMAGDQFDMRYIEHFLGKGGRVEHAVAAVVTRARDEHGKERSFYCDEMADELEALPAHPLDDDYAGLMLKLGFDRIGPFAWDESEDEDEEDEDEDEDKGAFARVVGGGRGRW